MATILMSDVFKDWLSGLRDAWAKARLASRIRSATLDNFGDVEPVGDGVYEMRIHHGPGYRLYYVRRGVALYLLLIGGDKASQGRDIQKAKAMTGDLDRIS